MTRAAYLGNAVKRAPGPMYRHQGYTASSRRILAGAPPAAGVAWRQEPGAHAAQPSSAMVRQPLTHKLVKGG